MENLYTVLITAITVLGSASAWRFYEKKIDKKREDEYEYKYECRSRILKLETLLEESSKEKDELRKMVLDLSTELAALRAKIEVLENMKK